MRQSELEVIKNCAKFINLNGRKALLEYDYRAYALIEEAIQKSVYELKDDILEGRLTLSNHLVMLYCGLLKHQNSLKLRELSESKNIVGLLAESFEAMVEAFLRPLLPVNLEESR